MFLIQADEIKWDEWKNKIEVACQKQVEANAPKSIKLNNKRYCKCITDKHIKFAHEKKLSGELIDVEKHLEQVLTLQQNMKKLSEAGDTPSLVDVEIDFAKACLKKK